MKIITEFVYPPIPIRCFDWSAIRDGYEPPDPVGHGATELEAIQDLIEQEDAVATPFPRVYCSQCGQEFGPADSGYSSCSEHRRFA